MNFPPSQHSLRLIRNTLGWHPGQTHIDSLSCSLRSRVFRLVPKEGTPVVVKEFAPGFQASGTFAREIASLEALGRHGIGSVPVVLHKDEARGVLIMSHLDGHHVVAADLGDDMFDPVVDFVSSCRALPADALGSGFPLADSSPSGLEAAIIQNLSSLSRQRENAGEWIDGTLAPAIGTLVSSSREAFDWVAPWSEGVDQPMKWAAQAFPGMNRALVSDRRAVSFCDFSDFGWWDPALLLARMLVAQDSKANVSQKIHLAERVRRMAKDDPSFERRLQGFVPLAGAQQVLDNLEEFVPKDRVLREFAGIFVVGDAMLDAALNRAKQHLEFLMGFHLPPP